LRHELEKVNAIKILEELDQPLAPILYMMEKRGVCLDRDILAEQSRGLTKDLQTVEKKIYEAAGETFNVGSPKQLAQILFDKLKLPPSKKTKTGFSTDNDVLEKLKSRHPIADMVLEYRELSKLKSTYVDSLPLLVKEDGRIHTHFNQALTTTGRLSSTEPNLQNIPIRTERGALVRRAFVADREQLLLSVDYSQIELRVLAHFSEDPNLMRAFVEDLDIHAATAAEVFGVKLNEVTGDQRRTAKAVNFGIAYGQGAFGLAENLGISRTEAAEIIKKYFARFARVQNYIEDTIARARSQGYVETLWGRRRYMDELKSKNVAIQKFGERAAINAPIQGTAADLVKAAMIRVEQEVQIPMLLQVHDELIFEGPADQVRELEPKVVSIMESVADLKVPLKANSAVGKNWDATK
jgi:DNA polymerase-1